VCVEVTLLVVIVIPFIVHIDGGEIYISELRPPMGLLFMSQIIYAVKYGQLWYCCCYGMVVHKGSMHCNHF
jgi:hypothetical protein